MWFQRSSKRMSPEEEGLRAMSGESRCSARESEQDVDQRAEVTEGVVLPERVIVAELVLCLTRRSFLLICCCSGLQKHCIA